MKKRVNGRVVALRLTDEEYIRLKALASTAALKVSAWLRDVILRAIDSGPAATVIAAPRRSWQREWLDLETMNRTEAVKHFQELRAGRPLPEGFLKWPRQQRIDWLEENWPL